MSETTSSGVDFQIHPAMAGQFSADRSADTYAISNGIDTWKFNASHLEGNELVAFGQNLSSLILAVYQAGVRSSGKPEEIPGSEEPVVITADPETIAISGAADPSMIPGASYLTEEGLEKLSNPEEEATLEIPPPPIAPLPKELQ